jgi:hypothetical protein
MTNDANDLELVILDVKPGGALESQSGLQNNRPRIYGALAGPNKGRIGAIILHPTSNFMGHYLLEPMARRGIGLLALNSRYAGNDSVMLMERVIQDLGAGMKFMRDRFETVFLIGNSGGAAVTAFYQAQAEKLTVVDTPAGDPIELQQEDLPRADGIALLAGHQGRSRLILNWLDASLTAENDALSCDPQLDIYDPRNGPPFDTSFVQRIRDAQRQRSDKITQWVKSRLEFLRGSNGRPRDEAFVVYRTYADPRFVDLSLDPNDRKPGGNRGDNPRQTNYGVNNLARYTSLTAWLSQWSLESRADGPSNLAKTSVPVLHLEYTADGSIFPSDIKAWSRACSGREEFHRIVGGNHYLLGQPELVMQTADLVAEWTGRLPRH